MEVIGRTNKSGSSLRTKFVINKNIVTSEIGLANHCNKFFTNIGPELARNILTTSRTFESFLNKIYIAMPADPITINELKSFFFSLKINKSPGYGNVSSYFIKNCFSELNYSIIYLFRKSIISRSNYY